MRDCNECLTKRAVHGGKLLYSVFQVKPIEVRLIRLIVGDSSEVTFRNVTGTGARQWLSFHYRVNNPEGMS